MVLGQQDITVRCISAAILPRFFASVNLIVDRFHNNPLSPSLRSAPTFPHYREHPHFLQPLYHPSREEHNTGHKNLNYYHLCVKYFLGAVPKGVASELLYRYNYRYIS